MDTHPSSSSLLSAAEFARFESYILDIARQAKGAGALAGDGTYRFGAKQGLCVYLNGQFHDFSGGPRPHGHGALELVQHLYPNEDPIAWAIAWLAQHPGNGAFIRGEGEPGDDFKEVEATAYINALYNGGALIDDTPGYAYILNTRGLPILPEDQAQLRWVADFRGDEGLLIAPATDNDGKVVKLLGVFVTPDGRKSPLTVSRYTILGARRPGLVRFGAPGPNAVETEGIEKGLAARSAGAEYVVVCSGVSNLGKIPLPPVVRSVIIARDADPAGSPSDQALWCGAIRRQGQGLKVAVTARPNDIAPKEAPPLKDLDDVWRYDPELASILLEGANLEHGRLGEAVDNAILDLASRLDAIALGRARKGIAQLLGIPLGALDDELARRIQERIEAAKNKGDGSVDEAQLTPWEHPVTDLGAVLDDMVGVFRKVIAAPDTHHDTEALWAAHAHVLQRRELNIRHSARLAFQSQFEDSGKTTAMSFLAHITARAMATSSLSGASMFRETDANHWTILWDEADNAFHKNANPELIGIFNAGHSRKFSKVHRQVPSEDGGYESRTFDTFTAIALTAINIFPSRAMQSRCIVLVMRRATKAEAARLEEFDEGHEAALTVCGRKLVRWAADVPALPEISKKDTGLINRIWLNWRPLLQIAELAGGTWPARALAAANADMARVRGERDDSQEFALLDAIWRVLAADKSDPRRMLTHDLTSKLVDEDEGRWRKVCHGDPIDEYYLREKLKKLLPGEKELATLPTRRWRAEGNPKGNPQYGYHELHLADAFERYLGKGLPSTKLHAEGDNPNSTAQNRAHRGPTPNTGGLHTVLSDTSDTIVANATNTNTYPVSNAQIDPTHVLDRSDTGLEGVAPVSDGSDTCVGSNSLSDTEQYMQDQDVSSNVSDVSDKSHIRPPVARDIPIGVVQFPQTPTGRRARKEP